MPDTLPATVKLIHPSAAQISTQLSANSASWRGLLPVASYIRRENFLLTQGVARDSGLTAWALVDTRQSGAASDAVLAGCETIRKRALVSTRGALASTTAHGLCSVFTPAAGRGRGAATRMIAEVTRALPAWQQELGGGPCLFAALYSDIGKEFYARNGWKVFPSAHIRLAPVLERDAKLPATTPLRAADLAQLCARDEALIRAELERHTEGTAVAFLPDHETMLWHHAREEFVANELYRRKPKIKGARVQVAGDLSVWVIWSRFFEGDAAEQSKGHSLRILRLAVDGGADAPGPAPQLALAIAAVLHAAQLEAAAWNMEEVEIWNPDAATVEAARMLGPEVRIVHRESDSIASLVWYGDPAEEESLRWIGNEKYAWC